MKSVDRAYRAAKRYTNHLKNKGVRDAIQLGMRQFAMRTGERAAVICMRMRITGDDRLSPGVYRKWQEVHEAYQRCLEKRAAASLRTSTNSQASNSALPPVESLTLPTQELEKPGS